VVAQAQRLRLQHAVGVEAGLEGQVDVEQVEQVARVVEQPVGPGGGADLVEGGAVRDRPEVVQEGERDDEPCKQHTQLSAFAAVVSG